MMRHLLDNNSALAAEVAKLNAKIDVLSARSEASAAAVPITPQTPVASEYVLIKAAQPVCPPGMRGRTTIRRAIKSGVLPGKKIGGRWVLRLVDVEAHTAAADDKRSAVIAQLNRVASASVRNPATPSCYDGW